MWIFSDATADDAYPYGVKIPPQAGRVRKRAHAPSTASLVFSQWKVSGLRLITIGFNMQFE